MKSKFLVIAATVLLAVAASGAGAAEDVEKAIGARQAVMKIYSFNLGRLGSMAKGETPYDAEAAKAAADNLLAAASMKNSAMWPGGSGADNAALAGKTRAKGEIWSTYPKVSEKSKDLVKAATAMAAAAGDGLEAVRANIGAVGGACKGCHEPFRVPK